jgi:hypothetical protein
VALPSSRATPVNACPALRGYPETKLGKKVNLLDS